MSTPTAPSWGNNEPLPVGLGATRTHVGREFAVIGPDSHVVAPLTGWRDTPGVVLMAPGMSGGRGPGFVQYLAVLEEGSASDGAPSGCERVVYVLDGRVEVNGNPLGKDAFAWLPPDATHDIRSTNNATLWVHEQRYTPHPDRATPDAVFGRAVDATAEPFMGDPAARLAKLLPPDDAFDLEVNRFTFGPGAALPLVESHVNEHGLLMLEGTGVYRLGSGDAAHWQVVRAGDAIWMGPFCPQWFGCLGTAPATYLYSKNVNRAAALPSDR